MLIDVLLKGTLSKERKTLFAFLLNFARDFGARSYKFIYGIHDLSRYFTETRRRGHSNSCDKLV